MPFAEAHRVWLGDVFQVSRYAPGSGDDLAYKAKQAYEKSLADLKSKGLETLIEQKDIKQILKEAKLDKAYDEALESVKDPDNLDASTKKSRYESAQKKIEEVYSKCIQGNRRLQEEFTKQYATLKPALIFARNTSQANKEVEQGTSKSDLLLAADEILKLEQEALQARDTKDYALAQTKIESAVQKHKDQQAAINKKLLKVKEATQSAKDGEQNAFNLFVGNKKEMRDMVGDPDMMQLMLGGKANSEGKAEKSKKLIAMELVFEQVLKRFDDLMKSGVNAPDAADVAFANLPRAFWPDRAIREIDMFYRVERQIELDESNQQASSLRERLEDGQSNFVNPGQEYGELGVSTTGDTIESVLKIQLGWKTDKSLPKIGSKEFNELKPDQQSLLKLQNVFGDTTKGVEGFGVALKAITAISKIKDSVGDQGGPVQEKIAEFERNAALFDLALKAKDYGANLLKDVCPALGIVAGAVDMVVSMYKAAKYFKKLADIQKLGNKAERDPKSVVYLPLIRMDKHERLKGAEQVMVFIEKSLAVAGKSAQLSGIGAPAGLGIDVAGKIVSQGSKFVFANIKWSDAKKAQKALRKAKGPPVDREMVAEVFKYSNKYATYCLAIAAVEDNDPWAVRYCTTSGLSEGEVSDPNTSVMVLRRYILVESEMDDQQDTFADTLVGKGATKIVESFGRAKDFVTGRKKWADYDPTATIKTPVELKRTAWQAAKTEALACGWYDDRSGLGDVLTDYEDALAAWENVKSTKTKYATDPTADILAVIDELCGQANRLYSYIASIKPLAKDEVTPHAGMTAFVDAMWQMAYEASDNFNSERTPISEKYYKSNEGQDIIQKAKDKLAQDTKDRLKVLQEKIDKFVDDADWDTPFGPCKLANYEALTCKSLNLNPSAVAKKIDAATKELRDLLIDEAKDLVGGYASSELDDALSKVFNKPLKGIAYDYFVRLGTLARDLKAELLSLSSTTDNLTGYGKLSSTDWASALSQATKDGLVKWRAGDPGSVAEALDGYETEMKKYNSSGIENYLDDAGDYLRQLQEILEPLEPVDQYGLPFVPMVDVIRRLDQAVTAELDKLDKASPANQLVPSSDPAELSAQWWEDNKSNGVQNHLLRDASTGIGKALAAVDANAKEYDKKKTDVKLRKAYVKSLDKLAVVLNKYEPTTKSKNPFKDGKPHPGGALLRKLLLEALDLKYAEVESAHLSAMNSQAITFTAPVSQNGWSAAKKEFVDHGMVDKKTGIGAAIKSYLAAKDKSGKAQNDPKLKKAFETAAERLLEAAFMAKPTNALGKEFKPAVAYLDQLSEVVRKEAGLEF